MFYSERSQGSPQAVRLCRLQNRSLLSVNEDFEGKRNTEIYFLVTPFIRTIYRSYSAGLIETCMKLCWFTIVCISS